MQLQSIYVRFYRSLNYDFIRSSDGRYEPDPGTQPHAGTTRLFGSS